MRTCIKRIFKWLLISVLIGAIGGILGSVFHHCIEIVTHTREKQSWLILFLPLAGLVITALYNPFRSKGALNTNRILSSVEADDDVPIILSPLIFVGTLITHLFGGSAGREGAALQLGGSIGYNIGRLIKLDKNEMRTIVMAGMSSFFSAMFGAPLTAAIFSLEVIKAKNTHRRSLLPCIISSVTAYIIARFVGAEGIRFSVEIVGISWVVIAKIAILAGLCALVSIVFCLAIKYISLYAKKLINNDYIKAVVGGAIIICFTLILRTTDYNGAGMSVIERAMKGEASYEAFALKIIFTAVTIAAGFKGGEIVPVLFVGSTFGCAFGGLLGIDPSFAASLGFVALFSGVVKCPLASVALAVEVFGGRGVLLYALACVEAYFLSGKFSIYEHKENCL